MVITRARRPWFTRWWSICLGLGLSLWWIVVSCGRSNRRLERDHEILQLIKQAEMEHARIQKSQPRSYREAVKMYRRRHKRVPPPGYEQWFDIAQRIVGACNPAGYHDLYENLEMWHALSAREIRARNEQLVGTNGLGRVRIRRGEVRRYADVEREQPGSAGTDNEARDAMERMLEAVVREWDVHLPDLDMWVNGHDEARIIVSYEDKQRLLSLAKQGRVRTPIEEKPEWRSFGGHITRHASVRTNCEWPELRCPTSWASLRKVCPPESLAAQSPLVDLPGSISTVTQNYTSRFTTPIGHFLSSPDLEQTTWCDQPDLQHLHAMHTYPLTWPYTIQLYPVFTCSKVPGYDDILFPAWWYWRNQTPYKDHKDPDWDNKRDELYWRGANTGGMTMGKLYKGWLRSRAVALSNPLPDDHNITDLQLTTADGELIFTSLRTRTITSSLFDVAMNNPDHGDEDSKLLQLQDPELRWARRNKFERQYESKIILDLDGTAYSGRFASIMHSKSAVFKATLFREAVTPTLVPWYHYVPVSIRLVELPSLVSFFLGVQGAVRASVAEGLDVEDRVLDAVAHDEELRIIGERGREWAETCGRREEHMLYAYLLALEWSRLLNDDKRG